MAHEPVSPTAAALADVQPTATPLSNGLDGADDANRPPRLPRWTRQEILVLIQGKKVAENRVRRGRASGSALGSNLEPKWASVSSYCKRHGVNRGPVQCRKRWSNLAGDYKKIKEWELQIKEESESFWVMRNDLRRERKLPGFFDREVYDILDGRGGNDVPTVTADVKDTVGLVVGLVAVPVAEEEEAVFDSGRSAAAEDGVFSDFDQSGQEEAGGSPEKETAATGSPTTTVPAPLPISEKQYLPFYKGYLDQGTANEKQPTVNPEKGSTSQEVRKRRRLSTDVGSEGTLPDQLVEILERNSKMLATQLEAQNMNCQLDRDQRKDHGDSLVSVLGKLADALGRIADKL